MKDSSNIALEFVLLVLQIWNGMVENAPTTKSAGLDLNGITKVNAVSQLMLSAHKTPDGMANPANVLLALTALAKDVSDVNLATNSMDPCVLESNNQFNVQMLTQLLQVEYVFADLALMNSKEIVSSVYTLQYGMDCFVREIMMLAWQFHIQL